MTTKKNKSTKAPKVKDNGDLVDNAVEQRFYAATAFKKNAQAENLLKVLLLRYLFDYLTGDDVVTAPDGRRYRTGAQSFYCDKAGLTRDKFQGALRHGRLLKALAYTTLTNKVCEVWGLPKSKRGRTALGHDIFGDSLFDPAVTVDDLKLMLGTTPQKCGLPLRNPALLYKNLLPTTQQNSGLRGSKFAALNNNCKTQPLPQLSNSSSSSTTALASEVGHTLFAEGSGQERAGGDGHNHTSPPENTLPAKSKKIFTTKITCSPQVEQLPGLAPATIALALNAKVQPPVPADTPAEDMVPLETRSGLEKLCRQVAAEVYGPKAKMAQPFSTAVGAVRPRPRVQLHVQLQGCRQAPLESRRPEGLLD
jgi:hypothetical protein